MVRPPYRTAVRLYAIAADRWALIDAEYLAVDLMRLPPDRFLNAVFKWCVDRFTDQKELDSWLAQLDAPLPGERKKPRALENWDTDDNSFMTAMAALGQGG